MTTAAYGDNMWFLIIQHPGVPNYDIWWLGLGPEPDIDMDLMSAYIQAGRDYLGWPPDEIFPEGWDCSVSQGMPHSSLLAKATYHDGPPELP